MTYLVDSQTLLWYRQGNKRLSRHVRLLLDDPAQSVFYSVITPWELSIKHAKGKLMLPMLFFDTLSESGFACLPIEETHVISLRTLPFLHGDPFDRMLVAQAHAEKFMLITADKQLAAYPIQTLLVSA